MNEETKGRGVEMDKKSAITLGIFITVILSVFLSYSIYKSVKFCAFSGCEYEKQYGSEYCELHALSVKFYGTPDYEKYWKDHPIGGYKPISGGSSSSYVSSGSSGSSSSKKHSSGYDSYDEGYNDVYEDDDYDWDRYFRDPDYADGVDDALDELGY